MSKLKVEEQLIRAEELGKRWVDFGKSVVGWENFGDYSEKVGVYRSTAGDHTAVQFNGLQIGYHRPAKFEFTLATLMNLENTLNKAEVLLGELIADRNKQSEIERKQAIELERKHLRERLKQLEGAE